MRLGGRLAAAIEILADMERRHRPAADALKDWGLSHRFAGAGDRGAIGNMVYDALRRRRSAAWLTGDETPRGHAIGALLLEWRMAPRALNEAMHGDRFAPAPLSEADVDAIVVRDLGSAPPQVRADVPDWCVPLLERAFGETWASEGQGLSQRPPLDLRVNTLKVDRPKVLAELASTGAGATELAAGGIRIPPIDAGGRHPNVQAEPAFQKGWFEVQDEGSQLVSLLAEAEAGMQVLDFCAGAGGKTLALAAAMGNHGQIFAHDADKTRLAPIFDRLRRADCRNVQVAAKPVDLAPLEGRMELVLVDAPCTGSGTWRRRPDAKWRLSEKQLELRRAEQQAILLDAARYVRPGGRLVYITCSVFDAENRDAIAGFTARAADFRPSDHREIWERQFPGSAAAHVDAAAGIRLTPATSGTDGFYFCALRKTGAGTP